MKLAFNHTKKYWEAFAETVEDNEIFVYLTTKFDPNTEDDVIAIYEIDHWTEDDIINFEGLHYEDQESVLEKLTATFTTEK